jgi:hypothetical protein
MLSKILEKARFITNIYHKDKVFYIIGIDEGWCGLYAIVMHQLTQIAYAIDKGYIPVVDLQNFRNQYIRKLMFGKENAWEYYFEQPMGYSLKDIRFAKNKIYSSVSPDPPDNRFRISYANTIYNNNDLLFWKKIYNNYVKFNVKTLNYLETNIKNSFRGKENIIGVLCRGTDFISLQPTGHPIQPKPMDVVDFTKIKLKEWNCEYVYLATEDVEIFNLFQSEFGDQLIVDLIDRWSTNDLKNGMSNSDLQRNDEQRRMSGLNYISQIYNLTNCDFLIAGSTRGSLASLLMNNNFKEYYIYNLGLYK